MFLCWMCVIVFYFFKQKTAYEMRISDWSSDLCSSDLPLSTEARHTLFAAERGASARKAWLAGGLTAKGRVEIDAGAAKALHSGASLLEIGRAAWRERGCKYVEIAGDAVTGKKKE